MFTSYASTVLTSLGYHKLTEASLSDESRDGIRTCIYWCYYYDKTLSMLLAHPPSLPRLNLQAANLVKVKPGAPLTRLVKVLVALSQLQESALDLMFNLGECESTAAKIATLRPDMEAILGLIRNVRSCTHPQS